MILYQNKTKQNKTPAIPLCVLRKGAFSGRPELYHALLPDTGLQRGAGPFPHHSKNSPTHIHLSTDRQLPEKSHLWQEVAFTPAGCVARQPDVEEGLQSSLCCLALGQLLAASRAFERPPVHAHSHDKTLDSGLLGCFREAHIPQT